jgi:hypothetical protein
METMKKASPSKSTKVRREVLKDLDPKAPVKGGLINNVSELCP